MLLLAGCGHVDVNSPSIRGIGYVRLDEVVKHHPLYAQLGQLDDAIAAINLVASAPAVPRSAAEIAGDTKALNVELKAAQDRANKVLAQKQVDYANRERIAVNAALVAAGAAPQGAQAGAQMSAQSAQQAQNAASAANADYMAYQNSVIAQNGSAIAAVAKEFQAQANRKFQARVEELQQAESQLSLELSQADAPQRLSIKTRLSNLAFDDATRNALRAQYAALDKKEAVALGDLRSRDQVNLNAYRTELQTQTAVSVRTRAAQINGQTRDQLQSRRNQVTSQIRGLGAPPLPSHVTPDLQAKISQIHQQFAGAFQADAQQTIDEYTATKADLDRQYAALHGADVGATGAAGKQLQALQQQRSDLYDKIVAQIKSETARIARDRGLNVVFENVEAAAGGYDLTDEISKDVEGLHE
jgi:hypothetical protein